jgi:hypothetical protein
MFNLILAKKKGRGISPIAKTRYPLIIITYILRIKMMTYVLLKDSIIYLPIYKYISRIVLLTRIPITNIISGQLKSNSTINFLHSLITIPTILKEDTKRRYKDQKGHIHKKSIETKVSTPSKLKSNKMPI